MRKVFFATNLPSPYRVDFFNELGKYCCLEVAFERLTATDRDSKWKGAQPENFEAVYLGAKPIGTDRSIGLELARCIARHKGEIIILTNYVSPSTMIAIFCCQLMRIPYFIEHDGGFEKKDPFLKGLLKKRLLKPARAHFTTCEQSISYLKSIGISSERIHKYPFTSLKRSDVDSAAPVDRKTKEMLKEKLGIRETKTVLSVGRFTYQGGYGKGYDNVLKAAMQMRDVGFLIVGDDPTQEFLEMKARWQLDNVHFIGFKNKRELSEYYRAADLFLLLTRGDVWGLVVNEAMMYGLPVITTTRCNAGLEMVKNGENGYIVEPDAADDVVSRMQMILSDDQLRAQFSLVSREVSREYTIENMVFKHLEVLNNL